MAPSGNAAVAVAVKRPANATDRRKWRERQGRRSPGDCAPISVAPRLESIGRSVELHVCLFVLFAGIGIGMEVLVLWAGAVGFVVLGI